MAASDDFKVCSAPPAVSPDKWQPSVLFRPFTLTAAYGTPHRLDASTVLATCKSGASMVVDVLGPVCFVNDSLEPPLLPLQQPVGGANCQAHGDHCYDARQQIQKPVWNANTHGFGER